MAQKTKRIGALIAAIVFLVSSLATSAAVIWLMVDNKDNTADPADLTSQQAQQESETNPLVGTTLADFTPVSPVTELKTEDVKVGDGAEATATSTVTVSYVGALASNGKVFDASPEGQPITFSLSQVIPGWQQGVAGMKVGGTRKIWIPAALAYGEQSPSSEIPPNSDLYFEVTLMAVQ